MVDLDFRAWFSRLAGSDVSPHEWQAALASDSDPRSRIVRIPAGMGKTLGVLGAWTWNRVQRRDDAWPRRLVWCLPMRVLVEQTYAVVAEALGRFGWLWDGITDHSGKIGVHLLMGGVDAGGDWNLFPEESAVLIGTQDMLLSRALNRGYSSGRARWPLEFGLLGHDALWVMDEVQLMDVGLATSAQLQAYHGEDSPKGFRPRVSWWMSATLQPEWLKSVDTEPQYAEWTRNPVAISRGQRAASLGVASKTLELAVIDADDAGPLAERVLAEHAKLNDGPYGRITLVVCNRVDRARKTFDALCRWAPSQAAELVHGRFRPAERAAWRQRFLSREACQHGADRIIVATQVVEAGVDISAGCVVTDLAPWSSLVQRFGRCARYGGDGTCVVVDGGRDEIAARPYEASELESAWRALAHFGEQGSGVSLAEIEAFEDGLDDAARIGLYPFSPRHLLLRRDFDELFDTTPDLTGADLDISRFIRSGDDHDLQLFWLDIPKPTKGASRPEPPQQYHPRRDELCAVPFLLARDWLCGAEKAKSRKPRLRTGVRAWVWDWVDGAWAIADRAALTPGRIVCVAADTGGYDLARGFGSTSAAPVAPVLWNSSERETDAQDEADRSNDTDTLSATAWKTIACHGAEVSELAGRIAAAVRVPEGLRNVLTLAGRWHDVGKSHPAFQGAIRRTDRPDRQDLAKAPADAWPRAPRSYRTRDDRDLRPGLRHELASALSLFDVLARYEPRHPALLGPWEDALTLIGQTLVLDAIAADPTALERAVLESSAEDFDLLAYLVACHHGKVRAALHAGPKDQDYRDPGDGRGLPIRGVREGDGLPSIRLDHSASPLPELRLTLEPANLGLSARTGRSWRERTIDLVTRFGPGTLAWLEAILIAADRRASMLATPDPELAPPEVTR